MKFRDAVLNEAKGWQGEAIIKDFYSFGMAPEEMQDHIEENTGLSVKIYGGRKQIGIKLKSLDAKKSFIKYLKKSLDLSDSEIKKYVDITEVGNYGFDPGAGRSNFKM